MYRSIAMVGVLCITLGGCVNTNMNDIAKEIGKPSQETLEARTLQIRRFDTVNEHKLLDASSQVLQDLGFIISESQPSVGVLVGSKERSAEEAGEVATGVAVSVLGALLGAYIPPTWSTSQSIHATMTTFPIKNAQQTDVRLLLERHITNNHGLLSGIESVKDPEIYQGFFEKLSNAVFLEAHGI